MRRMSEMESIEYVSPTKVCPCCKREFPRWGRDHPKRGRADGKHRGATYCRDCNKLKQNRISMTVVMQRKCAYCGRVLNITRCRRMIHKQRKYRDFYCDTVCSGLGRMRPWAKANPLGSDYCRFPGCDGKRYLRASFCGHHEYLRKAKKLIAPVDVGLRGEAGGGS